MDFKTIFYKENNQVIGRVLDFEGVIAQCSSIDMAKKILKDAMITVLQQKIKREESIKQNINYGDIKKIVQKYQDKESILGFITIDDKLVNKEFFQTERTNLSVIKGYKERAKKDNINLSAFLNNALEKKYR